MNNYHENLRHYIWSYFELHAKQRLITFNYYILISTLLSSGYLIALRDIPLLSLLLSTLLIILSFIFWKLDLRNKQLIKNSENALKCIEGQDSIQEKGEPPNILNIFNYEQRQTEELKKTNVRFPWNKVYTYSTCLNTVFALFAIIGLFGLVYSIITLANG